MPRKEREKWERKEIGKNAFLSFPVPQFFDDLFSRFQRKSLQTGEKRGGTAKKGRKDVERQRTAIPCRSKLLNLARFHLLCCSKPIFAPIPTLVLPLSKPVLDPFPNLVLPLSKPILVPFLYYLAIISRCMPIAAQPLDHVGSSPVRRLVGGLYSWRGDVRDQFVQYVYSDAWEQVERCCQEGEGVGCAHCQEEEKTQRAGRWGRRGGEGETQSHPPAVPKQS